MECHYPLKAILKLLIQCRTFSRNFQKGRESRAALKILRLPSRARRIIINDNNIEIMCASAPALYTHRVRAI